MRALNKLAFADLEDIDIWSLGMIITSAFFISHHKNYITFGEEKKLTFTYQLFIFRSTDLRQVHTIYAETIILS